MRTNCRKGPLTFGEFLNASPRSKDGNILLEAPAREAETVALCRDDAWVVRTRSGHLPNQGRSEPRWLETVVQTIDSLRDDLERTHWRKIWHSMSED
jgi:hypothetical protein